MTHIEVLNLTSQYVTLFENCCLSLRWGHIGVGWPLIQNVWCPYKRGNLDTDTDTDMHRGKFLHKDPEEHGHLQAKERGLDRSFPHSPQREPILPTPWFWVSSLQICETVSLLFKPPSLWYFCYISPNKLTHENTKRLSSSLWTPSQRAGGEGDVKGSPARGMPPTYTPTSTSLPHTLQSCSRECKATEGVTHRHVMILVLFQHNIMLWIMGHTLDGAWEHKHTKQSHGPCEEPSAGILPDLAVAGVRSTSKSPLGRSCSGGSNLSLVAISLRICWNL